MIAACSSSGNELSLELGSDGQLLPGNPSNRWLGNNDANWLYDFERSGGGPRTVAASPVGAGCSQLHCSAGLLVGYCMAVQARLCAYPMLEPFTLVAGHANMPQRQVRSAQ